MKAGFGQPANYPPQPTAYQQPAGYQPPPAGSPPAGYGHPASYQTPFQPQAPNQFSDQYSPPGSYPPNPYQAPNPWGENFYSPGYYNYVDRNRALSKAFGPAIFMQVYSGLILLGGIALAAFVPFAVHDMRGDDQAILIGIMGFGVFLCLLLGGLTFFAGMRFKILRSYGFVMTVVIGTLVIGFLTCLPAMFLAIWPMVVLMDSEVKACFDRPEGVGK